MLNEIIEISSGFQSSVNIAYDLHNEKKIQNFIPTTSSLELIANILLSTQDESTQRAKLLIGAYGRGKSHIILVALSILYCKDKKIFNNLLDSFKKYDKDLYKLANNYIKSKRKLLPVIISGSSSSLTQSFMDALHQALINNDLDDIMPETHFQTAIQTIKKWKDFYPDTYKNFSEKISVSINTFLKKLNGHDVESYKNFIEIYPELTAGSMFNPFLAHDVAKLYEDVSTSIKAKGYSGLYIVYDEFGKYLETSISSATESDTKFLQDLAEMCTRSGENQMHLMLICHKDISNYIDMNLPQDKVDGWRGISGRFEHINLHNNYSQMYEIIAAVIGKKQDTWRRFCQKHRSIFNDLAKRYSDNKIIGTSEDAIIETIVSCYPLHPSTMYILPRLSEKVAQNERTLFTFLSANHKNTLVEFVEKSVDPFPFVTPDYLYDYFEMQFKKELYSTEIYKIYHLSSRILRKVKKGSLQSKIIKTIALLYIIEQFEKFPPTVDSIMDIFIETVSDPKEISIALNDLIYDSSIVYLRGSNGYLKLKESSGIDIKEQISSKTEYLKLNFNTKDILNELAIDNYLYPVRYNDEHCITRYFEFKFISSIEYYTGRFDLTDCDACGVVQAVFFENADEFNNFNQSAVTTNDERIITIIPKTYVDISSYAFEYKALQELKTENVDDDIIVDEYEVFLEDLDIIIKNFISGFTRPEMQKVSYFHVNKCINLYRKAQLSALLSDICEHIYPNTPIINNESINKNVVPTVAVNSRTKLTTAILESDVIYENLGLSGTGQDVSFMRSTLIQTGILTENDGVYTFNIAPEDENMRNVLNIILNFFRNTAMHGEASFDVLYNELTAAQYGIGLKRGVIPIYIAVVFNLVKKDVVVRYKNEEVKISSDLLNSINEDPADYFAIMEDWDEDKRDYLNKLESIFDEHIFSREKNHNSFAYIASAMNRWYMSLPKCSKEMTIYYSSNKKIQGQYVKFINALKQPNNNSREFLMVDLPKIFKQNTATLAIADSISVIKEIYENGRKSLEEKLVGLTKQIFKGNKSATLISVLKDWFETLKIETIQHQYVNNENVILSLISSATNDEAALINKLAKAIVGLRIDDWDNNCIERFEMELINFKSTVEDYNAESHDLFDAKSRTCRFTFVNGDGNEITRVFERTEYSSIAKLLLNDITSAIEEIGQSISEQEKRQVLIEILEKMCQ